MREQGKGESAQQAEQPRESPEEAYRKALPPELVAVIGQAAPEIVGMLLANHPQMATPLMTTINQLRGHGFAQQAIAAAMAHPQHKPMPPKADAPPPPQHPAPPHQEAAPAPQKPSNIDPKVREMRAITGWTQLATAIPDESMTPEHVRIPAGLMKAIDSAWKDSLASNPEREQGGNIVRNRDGSYGVRRADGDADAGTFNPDEHDVGWTQSLVGLTHTHPYRDNPQVPEGFSSFSESDFDSFMRTEARVSVLRSGPFTFMLSKTKQFESMVEGTNNAEDKLSALSAGMFRTYQAAFDPIFHDQASDPGTRFSRGIEAGILAVCREFHLVYYEGQGSDLTRVTSRPTR